MKEIELIKKRGEKILVNGKMSEFLKKVITI